MLKVLSTVFLSACAIVIAISERNVVGGACSVYPYDGSWNHKLFYAFLNVMLSILYAVTNYVRIVPLSVVGACLFMRSDAFRMVGGYWKDTVCEDFSMIVRLSRIGKVVFVKSAVAYTSVRRLVKWGIWRTVYVSTQNL